MRLRSFKELIYRLAAGTVYFSLLVGALSLLPFQAAETASDRPETKAAPLAIKRADFIVTGASCVSCIRRLSWVLRHTQGVLNADVSIMKPHKAIVFFDSSKTSIDHIWAAAKTEKILKRVSLENLKETSVERLPTVIIPVGTN